MKTEDSRKIIERAEYRAKLIEAELNAVKSSKAYKLSKKLGIINAQLRSDPVGLSKKAAKMIFTNPRKARHMLRSASRGAFILQSVAEQTAKYQEWILLNEPDETELDAQREAAEKFGYKPLISIVTPVFNPPLDVFEELIESVLEQTYTNFELCLGNFGTDEEIETLIAKYAKLDHRVKHYTFDTNEGIAGNSNQILDKVKGEFIALLDHDDTISPDALYENVKLLNEKPYDFIYSDKDKIDDKGNRFDPLFKPQISPEMLLNINYLTHLNVMRTSIVKEVGAWDSATDGAQDWDLFLRVVSASKYIGHIPKVLYHWRVIATSTAMSIETKPYALANQCKAVDKYLKSQNIPAHAFVKKTELFLEWDKQSLDQQPIVFLYFSSTAHSLRAIRHLRRSIENPHIVVLVKSTDKDSLGSVLKGAKVEIAIYEVGKLGELLTRCSNGYKNKRARVALFLLDRVQIPKSVEWYANLSGWLGIKDVNVSSGRLVNRQDLIVSSGGIITPDKKYFPLFKNYPKYYQSYLGNAEWVRNLSAVSPIFCATKLELLRRVDLGTFEKEEAVLDKYFTDVTRYGRIVMTPHATAMVRDSFALDEVRDIATQVSSSSKAYLDPFSNPNMNAHDPLRLFEDEALQGLLNTAAEEPVDRYQHDATILADTFDITLDEIKASRNIKPNTKVQSVAWFLPSFDAVYAGLMNIFSFAEYLSSERNLRTTIYVLSNERDAAKEKKLVTDALPNLIHANFVALKPQDVGKIKAHDIGIATQWATTFPLAKANSISKKYYFIQDNETNFYPKGTISALVELSYRFGFTAIAGTDGLLDMYRNKYAGDGLVLKSKINLSAYHPRKDMYYTPKRPYKVFFYARPNMPRNAFELGIAGLKNLKQNLGNDVEIITAGAPWNAASYGVEGMFTNLGKIDYNAVPKLYRSVDAGLMFMFSGHPGVTASELMASGCPVVVNDYDDVTWRELYQHEKTCLITTPTASEVARNIARCLVEPKLRHKLIDGGIKKSRQFYRGYDESAGQVGLEITTI